MKLSQFRYNLPKELIAKFPVENRDESRLMVLNRKTGKIEHRIFKDIIEYFNENDVLVFNNTNVFPARLYGNKKKPSGDRCFSPSCVLWSTVMGCAVDPAVRLNRNKLYFGEDDVLVDEVIVIQQAVGVLYASYRWPLRGV
jgi:S-adenosylmethionine:tRNA ribosyltransferase-isomerase